MTAITEVEDYFNDCGRDYEHADSYSRAAKWMVIVAVLGSIYHFLMVFLRYLYINSRLKSLFHFYAYLVSSQLTNFYSGTRHRLSILLLYIERGILIHSYSFIKLKEALLYEVHSFNFT